MIKEFTVLEGETVLFGKDTPGVIIHDDGERLYVRFFGPQKLGKSWINTADVSIVLNNQSDDLIRKEIS